MMKVVHSCVINVIECMPALLTRFFRQDLLMRHFERHATRGRDLKRPSNKPLRQISTTQNVRNDSKYTLSPGLQIQEAQTQWLPPCDQSGNNNAGISPLSFTDHPDGFSLESGRSAVHSPALIPQATMPSSSALPQVALSPAALRNTLLSQAPLPQGSLPSNAFMPNALPAPDALSPMMYQHTSDISPELQPVSWSNFSDGQPMVTDGLQVSSQNVFGAYPQSLPNLVPTHNHGAVVQAQPLTYMISGQYNAISESIPQHVPVPMPLPMEFSGVPPCNNTDAQGTMSHIENLLVATRPSKPPASDQERR